MLNLKTGEIITSHSKNPVPIYIVGEKYTTDSIPLYKKVASGVLADVAPTILKIMGLNIPPEMTGKPLI